MRLTLLITLVTGMLALPGSGFAQRLQATAFAPHIGENPYTHHELAPLAFRVRNASATRGEAAWRGATIGFVIGAIALGSYAYFTAGECDPDDGCFTAIYTALGAGVGGIVGGIGGAVVGAARWHPEGLVSRSNRLTYAAADERSADVARRLTPPLLF